jgi:hypothetical protein
MADLEPHRRALIARVLDGDGRATPAQRRAAFDNQRLDGALAALVDKIARHAYKVTDEDLAAARAEGLGEDELFELAACAAIGQANRQYETALAALEAAAGED